MRRAIETDARAFGESVRQRVEGLIDASVELASNDPGRYDLLRGNLSRLVGRLGLPPNAQRALDGAARQRLALAVIDGLPTADGLTLLRRGELDDDLSPDVRDRVLAQTEARHEREQREARIEAAVGRSRDVFRLLTEINRDEATHADIDRLDSDIGLSAAERGRLVAAADRRVEAQRQEAADIALVDRVLIGGTQLDPGNADHRRAVDRHFLRSVQAWAGMPQQELNQLLAEHVGELGIVPEPILDAVKSYALAGSPVEQAATADLLERIFWVNPFLLDEFEEGALEALLFAPERRQSPGASPLLIPAAAPALPALPLILGTGVGQSLLRTMPLFAPLLIPGDKAQQGGEEGEEPKPSGPRPEGSAVGRLGGEPPPQPPLLDFPDMPLKQRQKLKEQGHVVPPKPTSPEASRRMGLAAINRVMATRESDPTAMFRPDLGWIAFDYGTPGDPSKDYEGGSGLSHIDAKHEDEDALRALPLVIAFGKFMKIEGPPNSRRIRLETRRFRAIVSLHRDFERETWVITNYDFTVPK